MTSLLFNVLSQLAYICYCDSNHGQAIATVQDFPNGDWTIVKSFLAQKYSSSQKKCQNVLYVSWSVKFHM